MPIVFALLTSGCESIIAKTGVRSGVRQKEKELRNYRTSQAETILNKYGKINPDAPDEYILPYFICLKNLKSQENKVHDIIRKVNRGLGKISSALGIQKTTTYTARHTYASFLYEFTPTRCQGYKQKYVRGYRKFSLVTGI